MFQLYPSKKHNKAFGKSSMSNNPSGTSYPGGMPNKQDDTMTVKCNSQSGNGASKASGEYTKKSLPSFPGLNGLPS